MNEWNGWRNPIELGTTLAQTLPYKTWAEVQPHAKQLWSDTGGALIWLEIRNHVQFAWEQARKRSAS